MSSKFDLHKCKLTQCDVLYQGRTEGSYCRLQFSVDVLKPFQYSYALKLFAVMCVLRGSDTGKDRNLYSMDFFGFWNIGFVSFFAILNQLCSERLQYRGARPGRKQATVTEDFDFHISYL